MSRFIETEAVKDFYTGQVFNKLEHGTRSDSDTSKYDLPSILLKVQPGALRFRLNSEELFSDISFAIIETSLANRRDIIKKPVIERQLVGRKNESTNRNKLEYRAILTCKPCKFQSSVV